MIRQYHNFCGWNNWIKNLFHNCSVQVRQALCKHSEYSINKKAINQKSLYSVLRFSWKRWWSGHRRTLQRLFVHRLSMLLFKKTKNSLNKGDILNDMTNFNVFFYGSKGWRNNIRCMFFSFNNNCLKKAVGVQVQYFFMTMLLILENKTDSLFMDILFSLITHSFKRLF